MKNLEKDLLNTFSMSINSKDTQDMHMRRISNMGDSKKNQDAVTRKEMIAQLNEIRAFVGMPLIED